MSVSSCMDGHLLVHLLLGHLFTIISYGKTWTNFLANPVEYYIKHAA